jgi:hypothetical protein
VQGVAFLHLLVVFSVPYALTGVVSLTDQAERVYGHVTSLRNRVVFIVPSSFSFASLSLSFAQNSTARGVIARRSCLPPLSLVMFPSRTFSKSNQIKHSNKPTYVISSTTLHDPYVRRSIKNDHDASSKTE